MIRKMEFVDPNWTAPRIGQDWREENIIAATAWLKSFVKRDDWERRIERVRSNYDAARAQLHDGRVVPLFDQRDAIAWQIFQAEDFATQRVNWDPLETAKIAPVLTRLGLDLDVVKSIAHVEKRAERLMTSETGQPESGLFELLVALAYKRRRWPSVEFIDETPGRGKTPDLLVSKPRSRWAVECKRLRPSAYSIRESDHARRLSRGVHDISLEHSRSIRMQVIFHHEVSSMPDDYLKKRALAFIENPEDRLWVEEESVGIVSNIDWRLIRRVMTRDFVYFGSSRMVELLLGEYDHQFSHDMAAKWRSWNQRSLYADAVYQASVVSWQSNGDQALRQKARHFRSVIAGANAQLPTDMPGAIHVGLGSMDGDVIDAVRHFRNREMLRKFQRETSRLRWIYANYMIPELTTRPNESWAINETMVPYRIGRTSTKQPLARHLLLTPDGEGRDGVHWDGLGP